jgi:hypothetical protein
MEKHDARRKKKRMWVIFMHGLAFGKVRDIASGCAMVLMRSSLDGNTNVIPCDSCRKLKIDVSEWRIQPLFPLGTNDAFAGVQHI